MGRVTVHVADSLLSALDEEAHNRSISRSQAVATAIEFFISGDNQALVDAHNKLSETHNTLSASEEEVMRLTQELSKLNNQIAENDKTLESNHKDVMFLEGNVKRIQEELDQARSEANKLREEVEQYKTKLEQANEDAANIKDDFKQLKTRYDQNLTEATQRWEEQKLLKNEIAKQKKALEEAQATNLRLQNKIIDKQTEADKAFEIMVELAAIRAERDKLQEAMRVRDDDVAWLRGHVAQLTQQLALPPSQEEAKKKGWWRFWR